MSSSSSFSHHPSSQNGSGQRPEQRVLITGAGGQIGVELTIRLRQILGRNNVLATDVRDQAEILGYPFEQLDVTENERLRKIVADFQPTRIYHLASLLSATAEQKPHLAWEVNVQGLLQVLEVCREFEVERLFWPSSIAVFGPGTPRDHTPQETVIDPATVYGISKLAGERWCAYYHKRYGLDVRSLRYPGLISYGAPPGGGTTDYAVDIFYKAIEDASYTCFLKPDAALPMMYMEDAIRGTLEIMDAPARNIDIRSSYNFAAVSFTPAELAASIQKRMPGFRILYEPDFRQAIADTWPRSIDDSSARQQWGWSHRFGLDGIVTDMLEQIRRKLGQPAQGLHS